jgi:hypothetical protein
MADSRQDSWFQESRRVARVLPNAKGVGWDDQENVAFQDVSETKWVSI